jgi:predicted nucleic-acid-binding protein
MRALDTNVLVRYLVADDARQLAAADRIIDECRRDGEAIFLAAPVLCELVWVLERCYQQSKAEVLAILDSVLGSPYFRMEHGDLVRQSVNAYREGKGNFPDYLIGEISRHAGCRDVVTFDRDLRGAPGFTVIA